MSVLYAKQNLLIHFVLTWIWIQNHGCNSQIHTGQTVMLVIKTLPVIYKSASRSKTSIFMENAKSRLKIVFWTLSECNKILLSNKNSKKNWNFLPKIPPNNYDPRAHTRTTVLLHQLAKLGYFFYHLQHFDAKNPAVSDRLSIGSRLARV